jgi:hypothetical protein
VPPGQPSWELSQATSQASGWAGARDQYAVLLPIVEGVPGAEHPHTLAARYQLAHWTEAAASGLGTGNNYHADHGRFEG